MDAAAAIGLAFGAVFAIGMFARHEALASPIFTTAEKRIIRWLPLFLLAVFLAAYAYGRAVFGAGQ